MQEMNNDLDYEVNALGDSNYNLIIESIEDVVFQNSINSLLELQIEKQKYRHSELVSIIETEGIQVELFWKRDLGDVFQLFLLLNSKDLRTILNTLEYRGYTILNRMNEEGYENILKERYDQLMNYINI